jgi:hypothetical protein
MKENQNVTMPKIEEEKLVEVETISDEQMCNLLEEENSNAEGAQNAMEGLGCMTGC